MWRVTNLVQHIRTEQRISIHTLRVESDQRYLMLMWLNQKFQSTLSVWRVTIIDEVEFTHIVISIHTLRVESDLASAYNTLSSGISIHTLRVESDLHNLSMLPYI